MKKIIPLIITMSAISSAAMAEYPTFYNDETMTYTSEPEADFPLTPAPCSDDDKECIDLYLDKYASYLEGNMNAQRPPSPVYSWAENECILNDAKKCEQKEEEWQAWNARAVTASLDFVQGAKQSEPLSCNKVYDWWGMQYVYKCQDTQ